MRNKQANHFAAGLSLAIILLGSIIVFYLSDMTNKNQAIIENNHIQIQQNKSNSIEPARNDTGALVTGTNIQKPLSQALNNYDPAKPESITEVREINQNQFLTDLIDSKDEIVSAIYANQLDVEELGYLFLPENPSSYAKISAIPQNDVPLILQKDAHWRETPYGTNTTKQLGENGCAIASLAMVHSALSGQFQKPEDILAWAKEHYYVNNEGTSWQIFGDFAQHFRYQFTNYGNNFYEAMDAVNDGQIVIASVEPGYFTEIGHILVIRGYHDGKVYVNDPNDDPLKMFSIQGIEEDIFLNEGVNYWAYSK